MKKLWAISISAALLVGALAFAPKAQQVRATDYTEAKAALTSLLTSPISEDHTYTKKTEIVRVSDAVHDIRDYLHAKSLQLKRATYYDEDDDAMLLMGDYDGGFASINSGYKTIDGKGHHFSYKGAAAPSTSDIFTNIKDDGVWLPHDTVNSYFTNLTNIAAWCGEHYNENWVWNNNGNSDPLDDVFIYTIPSGVSGDSESVELDETFIEFQQFAAPLLLNNIGAYLTPTRVVIQNAAHFLSIRLFTSSTDSGKLTVQGVTDAGDMLLAEARIFKGISFNPEPYFDVRGTFNDWTGGADKFEYYADANLPEQYRASIDVSAGDLFKVYIGAEPEESRWKGAKSIEDGSSWTWIEADWGADSNIEVRVTGQYDLYWKPNASKFAIVAPSEKAEVKFFFNHIISWAFNDSATVWAHFFNWTSEAGTTSEFWQQVTEYGTPWDEDGLNYKCAYATTPIPDGYKYPNRVEMVRCPAGTTQPSWSATGDNPGRIYNKSTYTLSDFDGYRLSFKGDQWQGYNPS